MEGAIAEMLKIEKARRVTGVGRAAVLSPGLVSSQRSLTFWDDDTPCIVYVVADGENVIVKDPVAFGKEVAGALTPAALPVNLR
jgi:hypothetical protein